MPGSVAGFCTAFILWLVFFQRGVEPGRIFVGKYLDIARALQHQHRASIALECRCRINQQFALPELIVIGAEECRQVLDELSRYLAVGLQVREGSGGWLAGLPETGDDLIVLAQNEICGNRGLRGQLVSNLLAQDDIDRAARRAD